MNTCATVSSIQLNTDITSLTEIVDNRRNKQQKTTDTRPFYSIYIVLYLVSFLWCNLFERIVPKHRGPIRDQA